MSTPAEVVAPLTAASLPVVRKIGAVDVIAALREGWEDFIANPTSWIFLWMIYPVVGLLLTFASSGANLLPLVFPLASGFALVGPFAAIGIYEMSKRREQGLEPSWDDAKQVLHSPAIKAILKMGLLLLAIFAVWIVVAFVVYNVTNNGYIVTSVGEFVRSILTTPNGWALIVIGNALGFLFAAGVLVISAVSFPLLLDRPTTDVSTAIRTSIEAVRVNPVSMSIWGLIVAVLLVLGSIPLLVGLAIVMPLLGHATWHLYRKLIA